MADPAMALAREATARESFFAGLPTEEFEPWEVKLREALLDCFAVHPGHPFPLIQWIDRRMGGEIRTDKDPQGFGQISPVAGLPPVAAAVSAAMSPMVGPAMAAGREPGEAAQAWLSSLPLERFETQEEALREGIFDFLAAWQPQELATLQDLCKDATIRRLCQALLPPEVSLEQWIGKRIGGEVEIRKDSSGKDIIVLTPTARPVVAAKFNALLAAGSRNAGSHLPLHAAMPRDHRRPAAPMQTRVPEGRKPVQTLAPVGNPQVWLASLPKSELTGPEAALRLALLNWLNGWPTNPRRAPDREMAWISDAAMDEEIHRCRLALLPSNVALSEWIDSRVGGEIELRKAPQGQVEVMIRGAIPGAPPQRGQKGRPPPARVEEPRRHDPSGTRGKDVGGISDFLDSLPADELTPQELALREAVLSFLQGKDSPQLKDVAKDPAVASCRAALLPPQVPLRSWLDRRIGGEVEVQRNSEDHFVLRLRRAGSTGQREDRGRSAEEKKPVADKAEKEAFFASLPTHAFTKGEEQLRDVLLSYIERSGPGLSPTISSIFNDDQVKKVRVAAVPKAISLKEWIERRMGGEVEVVMDPSGHGQHRLRLRTEPARKKPRH